MGYAGIPCDKLPRVVKEILLLICEMHDRNMVHFDIKPCNILVAEDGRLVLSDAAFCHKFPVNKDFEKIPYRGTEGFMAPEVFVGEDVDDARPADMYSLGMTIAMARGVVSEIQS
jgi:serine/threonine protein kinase